MKNQVSLIIALAMSVSLLLAGGGMNRAAAANMASSEIVLMPTSNVAAAYSSGTPKAGGPLNAFDGTGLTANGDGTYSHSTASSDIWITTNTTGSSTQGDCKQWVAVKFSRPINLAKMHVWNMNWKNGTTSYPVRSLKDVEVYVSSSTAADLHNTVYNDASGVWELAATWTSMAEGPDPADATYKGEEYLLDSTQTNVSWVLFRITANYTTNGYCGLSEVQFYEEKTQSDEPVITYDTTMYVAGNFTNWAADMQALPYAKSFPADSTISFKQVRVITKLSDGVAVQKDTTWYGQANGDGHMIRGNSTWTLDGSQNVLLTTDVEGTYTFSLSASTEFSVAWPAAAAVVRMLTTNVKSAKASHEGSPAIKAFDGSGLDAYGVMHSTVGGDGWRTGNGTGIAPQDYKYVAVQFNEPVDLAKMHIWNLNFMNGATSCTNRGFKNVEIWVSSSASDSVLSHKCGDESGVWTQAINTTLSQASGTADYAGEDVILPVTQKNVRWVMFLCVSNYGASASYCGLSEVQFYMESSQPVQYVYDTINYVAGNFTNWAKGMKTMPVACNFPADSTIAFKHVQVVSQKTMDNFLIETDTTWYGAKTAESTAFMTRDNNTWKLDGDKNVSAVTDLEGDYGFSLKGNGEFVLTWPEKSECKPGYELVINGIHHILTLNEAQTDYQEYWLDSVELKANDLIVLYDTCGATAFAAPVTGYAGLEKAGGDTLKVTEDAFYAFYFKPRFGGDELYVVKYVKPSSIQLMPTTNVAAAFSSGKPAAGREPVNAFNGAGLTDKGDGTFIHGISVNAMWATANETDNSKQSCKQWIAVKFTSPINLAKMHIWNMNWKGYTDRSLKNVEVYVSSSTADDLYSTKYNDPSGVWKLATTLDLTQGLGDANYTGDEYVMEQTQGNVTWVMFRVLTNYRETAATGAHYCGLSEVQFYNDTEFTGDVREQLTFVPGDVVTANPTMYAITWGKDGTNETVKMNAQKNGSDTLYLANIKASADSVVLVRCATDTEEIVWDGDGKNVWNQTANYELCDTMYFTGWVEETNLFTLSCQAPKPLDDCYGIILANDSIIRGTKNAAQTEWSEYVIEAALTANTTFQLYNYADETTSVVSNIEETSTSYLTINSSNVYEVTATGTYTITLRVISDDSKQIFCSYKNETTNLQSIEMIQGQRFNVLGQPVGENYKGIVIINGQKFLSK